MKTAKAMLRFQEALHMLSNMSQWEHVLIGTIKKQHNKEHSELA